MNSFLVFCFSKSDIINFEKGEMIMSTRSFTRKIVISDPRAVKKINNARKADSSDKYRSSVKNIEEEWISNRNSISLTLTEKY